MPRAQRQVATEDVWTLVRALRARELPRNRNFELHATPQLRAARRLHRFLASVERELRRASEVIATPAPDGGVRLELRHASIRARRTIQLDAKAHALLLEDEVLRRVLGPASPPPPDPGARRTA